MSRLKDMPRSRRRTKLEAELMHVDLTEQQLREGRSQVAIALALGVKIGLCRAISGDRYLGLESALERVKTLGIHSTFCVLQRDTVITQVPQRRGRPRGTR